MNQKEYDKLANLRDYMFKTYHKHGYQAACNVLEQKKGEIDVPHYIGYKAELKFLNDYEKEFKLTVSGDVGDKNDFTGKISDDFFRIDVTTNFDYKKYEEFEPFINKGFKYKIALIDKENFELKDIVDINFPICENCEKGRLFDLVLLGNENISMAGNRSWQYDQVLFQYCNYCSISREVSRINNTVQLPDLETLQKQISDYAEGKAINQKDYDSIFQNEYENQLTRIKRFLKNEFNKIPFGLCSNSYTITNPKNADGYKETKVYWQENFLKNYIPDQFGSIIIQ
ncbi:hypothetical protein [Fodinibius halophilus]|uniref:Uncharacterized protein n=1 Tax=Fodinibius halophilus TaxID=1736908 RepID=A0A6M1T492_9BACT|nr:hypothetical protein [Fodinibius halophilus]NGP90226.1 hypothetical protein [Fodinibius halophilus]